MAEGEEEGDNHVYNHERDYNELSIRTRKIFSMEGAKGINDEEVLITREGYKIFREQVVSKGKFAQYYVARSPQAIDCVVKVVPLSNINIKYKEHLQKQGTKILRYLKATPNLRVANVIEIYATKIKMYVFCETLSHDLERLTRKQALKEDEFKPWILDVLKGLHFLYDHGIGHRNIQPSNVVLTSDKSMAKLTGFGMAMVTWEPEKMTQILSEKEREWHFRLAPETFKSEYDVHMADVWAVGCIIPVLLTRKPCFEKRTKDHLDAFKTHLRRNEVAITPDLECFLTRTFNPVADRGQINELINHHWFGGSDGGHGHS